MKSWIAFLFLLLLTGSLWSQPSNPTNAVLEQFYHDVAARGFNYATEQLAFTVGEQGGGGGGGGPFTPINIGGATYIGGNPVTLITAGACLHLCEITARGGQTGGFWIDTTGANPVPGVSEFYGSGDLWKSMVGLTTAVIVIPVNTGTLTGTVE